MKKYEIVFVADPRLPDEEVVALSQEYQAILTATGGKIIKEESWGKRRLAYPIRKLTEGKYTLLQAEINGANPLPELEQRMQQSEKVLRYLTVRLDAGRLRERASTGKQADAAGDAEEK